MATLVATQYNPTIRAFDQRLRAAGKAPKVARTAVARTAVARTACMRKLLTICNALIKTATPWNLAGPSPTTGPNRQLLLSFRWGHVRQLDRVGRELLGRAWAAGAGPGDAPLTIDLDSTVCETFGLCKEGAQRHNYAGQRGYHPILAVAAGTGDVLMARPRQHRSGRRPLPA